MRHHSIHRIVLFIITLMFQGSIDIVQSSSSAEEGGGGVYCRQKKSRPNHMFSLWKQDFPFPTRRTKNGQPISQQPSSLCDGVIYERDNGEICFDGRVSYQQISSAIGNPNLFQPAARTVSVNGHLTAGSGNVVLGPKVRYLYDFVTSYTIDGTHYEASTDIVDHMLTASRGTIDSVCLRADFQARESWYSIRHRLFWLNNIDYNLLRTSDNIGLLFFGNFNSVVEFHTPLEDSPALNAISTAIPSAVMDLVNAAVGLFPASLYGLFPVFAVTGTSRVLISGSFSTKKHPNPFIAPDNLGQVEGVEIDTHWETLMDAIEYGGLFRGDKVVPLYMNVVIKRIEAEGTNYRCWGQDGAITASIDVESPAGWGDKLDKYIEDIIFPELSKRGDVSIHFGKRSPPNSKILQSAIDFYAKCGVETHLDLKKDYCYHPVCDRSNQPRKFTYPPAYYDDIPTY